MPRIPTPWSKKRGERSLGNAFAGVAGEAAFYASLFLIGVFGLSLVLINRFAPDRVPAGPADAIPSNDLSVWVLGTLAVAAIMTGAISLLFRLLQVGASNERRRVLADRAGSIEMIRPPEEDSPKLPHVPRGSWLTDSPGERLRYRLPVEASEESVFGPATLALLWNSAWFVLLAVAVSGYWNGQHRPILTGLLIPFGAIGWWSFRFFLSQLRQRAGVGSTIVEISNHPLIPGSTYQLYISQIGRMQLKRLTVQMTCEEETFYRQGTDVRVERHEAFCQVLWKGREVLVDPQGPWEQQLELTIPLEAMHSFVGTHNAIEWKIVVKGTSKPWPSFCRSFRVVVHPPGSAQKANPR
ncbi:hypothetical protein N9D23_08655 [Rubripirellula sp.]|nr:hypothetical protein [Rubripirellula sp.]MDF1842065.1 hypothetical protein [Rubripirellula sp.]